MKPLRVTNRLRNTRRIEVCAGGRPFDRGTQGLYRHFVLQLFHRIAIVGIT